ncbi:MAG: endolytic transglycosylase MltG, partial [Firmicutes bacterium]|nr:endolytic transglycosylase MltG [Bacillota bacterium]
MTKTRKKRRRRNNSGLLIILCLFFLLVLGYLSVSSFFKPVEHATNARQINITVPKNASTVAIADQLAGKGLIRSGAAFRFYARYHKIDGQFKPGAYQFNTAMTLDEITGLLINGPNDTVKITIPEGFTVAQIAELLAGKGIVKKDDFLRLMNKEWNYPYLKDLPAGPNKLEGYLFPDTYYISSATSPEKIIQMMLDRFDAVINEHNYIKLASDKGLTLNQAVTIASMVEREARAPGERALIAGVIYNRLKIGMPLQIDATVLYVLDKPKEVLLYKDLTINSP